MRFVNLLKRLDVQLYDEYCLENFEPKSKPVKFETVTKQKIDLINETKPFYHLKTIFALGKGDPAYDYLAKRKIPEQFLNEFRWAPGFKNFSNQIIPKKFDHPEHDEGRIVIPFFTADKKLFAFQGRSIFYDAGARLRYITVVIDPELPCLWGLDKVNFKEKIYVFEGVLDALFIPNSLAIAGSNFAGLRRICDPKNTVMVYDNEPASKETKKKIRHAIEQGFGVCIWPNNIENKDVNSMILNENLTADHIKGIINRSTYFGMEAKVML